MKNRKKNDVSNLSQKLWIVIGLLAFLAAIVIVATMGADKMVAPVYHAPAQIPPRQDIASGSLQDQGQQLVVQEGSTVRNDVMPMTPDKSRQNDKVDKELLPEKVIKLDIANFTWQPAEFTVKPGEAVTIAVTSADSATYIFAFDDPSLQVVRIGVAPGETRTMTFNAPTINGEYTFKSDMRGHANRGAVGKMIVK